MKEIIRAETAPKAIGPYSQGIKIENLLFLSGQLPIRPDAGKIVETTIEGQTRQVLENIKAILESEGGKMNDIIKTTVLLQSIDDFKKMNEVYAYYFEEGMYPARSAFEVACLPQNALVEIEVIAKKNS